jgi:hypothetical protein
LRCQNDATFRINLATQEFSTVNSCPLQFNAAGNVPQSCNAGQALIGQNVTANLKAA